MYIRGVCDIGRYIGEVSKVELWGQLWYLKLGMNGVITGF